MKIFDYFLIYFNLKKRLDPPRENWIEYANFFNRTSTFLFNDSNLFFIGMIVLSFVYLDFLIVAIFSIYWRCLMWFGDEADTFSDKGFEAQQMVYMVQSRHMQSLKVKLEKNPNLIDATFKNKSLMYWTKYYNNLEAHKVIINLMKEREIQRKKMKRVS